jgi:hypothetical protein
MPDPIYPVGRREDGVRGVPRVERQRLLSPTEREQARRKREEARRQRTSGRDFKNPPQERQGGVDYSA